MLSIIVFVMMVILPIERTTFLDFKELRSSMVVSDSHIKDNKGTFLLQQFWIFPRDKLSDTAVDVVKLSRTNADVRVSGKRTQEDLSSELPQHQSIFSVGCPTRPSTQISVPKITDVRRYAKHDEPQTNFTMATCAAR